jgi:hypothetical protein
LAIQSAFQDSPTVRELNGSWTFRHEYKCKRRAFSAIVESTTPLIVINHARQQRTTQQRHHIYKLPSRPSLNFNTSNLFTKSSTMRLLSICLFAIFGILTVASIIPSWSDFSKRSLSAPARRDLSVIALEKRKGGGGGGKGGML